MTVYQLTVTGPDDAFGGKPFTWRSKTLYRTKERAEKALHPWIEKLEREDRHALKQIDYSRAETRIIELELEEGD